VRNWLRAHRNRLAGSAAAALFLVFCGWQWRALFAWPATFGTGGNMVAWIACGVLAFGWQHRQNLKLHDARMALAQEHHDEALALAREHHAAAMARTGK
jgi:hypothetical protein